MQGTYQDLTDRIDRLPEEFENLRGEIEKAIEIGAKYPDAALTCVRKVMDHIVRELYSQRFQEPPGSRPQEELTVWLLRDGVFPRRFDGHAAFIRKLGNAGTHFIGEPLSGSDLHFALTFLVDILEW